MPHVQTLLTTTSTRPARHCMTRTALILTRMARHGSLHPMLSPRAMSAGRLAQDVTRPSQDALSAANPTRCGQVHPEIARRLRDHPDLLRGERPHRPAVR